jgi:EAL domain-containing protein (putative c-di-GMP-specific phosphodiesterase class I)
VAHEAGVVAQHGFALGREDVVKSGDTDGRGQIQSCIAQRAFHLAYQPIVHLETGHVTGVEALCRFEDGTPPEQRFQESEKLGLSADLDLAIIGCALADLPRLPNGYLSINLSPSTLLDGRVADVLLAPDVPARRIILEVTEHARITDYEKAQELLGTLRARGIRLAVDDAGAGYATFRHILSLRPDIIKMDRSITQDIDADTARRALATALATFGAEIGATVIAEGVETSGEILALRRAGIHRAQGFALAAPAPLPVAPIGYEPPSAYAVLDLRTNESAVEDHEAARSLTLRMLRDAVNAGRSAQAAIEEAVSAGRALGVTWEEMADIMGMTRQGVSKRYGRGRQQ